MKNALKRVRFLSVVLFMAIFVFTGCAGSDEDPDWAELFTFDVFTGLEADTAMNDWTVVYLPLDNITKGLDFDINRFHLHAGGGFGEFVDACDLSIQKIFVSTGKHNTPEQAPDYRLVYDFTLGNEQAQFAVGASTFKDSPNEFTSLVSNGSYTISTPNSEYVYGGNFGSGDAWDVEAKYWGFVIKTETGLGNIRVELFAGSEKRFGGTYGGNPKYGPALPLINIFELAD